MSNNFKIVIFLFLTISGIILATLGQISFQIPGNVTYFWPASVIQMFGAVFFGPIGIISGILFPIIANSITDPSLVTVWAFIPANFCQSFLPFYFFMKFYGKGYNSNRAVFFKFSFLVGILPSLIAGFFSTSIFLLIGKISTSNEIITFYLRWVLDAFPLSILFGTPIINIFFPLFKEAGLLYHSSPTKQFKQSKINSLPIFIKIFISLFTIAILPIVFLSIYQIINIGENKTLINLNPIFISLGYFLAIIISGIISNKLIVSIKSLNTAMLRAIDGNFNEQIPITSNDELGELSNSFNVLIKSIKHYQKELQATSRLAAIGQTTSTIAHDIRKPFSALKSILLRFDSYKSNPPELHRAIKEVGRSIKNVESMISDIMDFSREVKLEIKETFITNLIDFSINQVAQDYRDHDIDIIFQYHFKNKYRLLADEERLARSIINILGNAIEAITIIGNRKSGKIVISTEDSKIDNQNYINISIFNDGPLINEENIPNIFESSFTNGKKKGTGLGLASTQKTIYLHNGKIIARNVEKYSGVEFLLSLPAKTIEEKQKNNPSELDVYKLPKKLHDIFVAENDLDEIAVDSKINSIFNGTKRFKTLILEDEAIYRASIKSVISSHEIMHNMVTLYDADNVEDALEIIERENITHAIVDIDLGKQKNGYDFLKALQNKKKVISIVHSNRCIDEDKKKAIELGAINFAPKPLRLQDLAKLFDDRNTKDKDDYIVFIADDMGVMRNNMKCSVEEALSDLFNTIIFTFEKPELILHELKSCKKTS